MVVFIEDRVALSLANLLEDDLLGHLRGDAPQHIGRLVVANFATHLDIRRQSVRLGERDLVDRVFQLRWHLDAILTDNRVRDDRLIDVSANLARLLVQLGAHVLLGLVILPRRQRDRVLDRRDDDLRINALFPAQRFNALVKQTRHKFFSLTSTNWCARLNCPRHDSDFRH